VDELAQRRMPIAEDGGVEEGRQLCTAERHRAVMHVDPETRRVVEDDRRAGLCRRQCCRQPMHVETQVADDAEVDVAQERHRAVLAGVAQAERAGLREADRR